MQMFCREPRRQAVRKLLSGVRRTWLWDRDKCLRAASWFGVGVVGLYGVVAVYETAAPGAGGVRVPVPPLVRCALATFQVVAAYLALGSLFARDSEEHRRARAARGLAEMAGRTNTASIVVTAYGDPRVTLEVLNDLCVFAEKVLGTSPDYDSMLKEPIDQAVAGNILHATSGDEAGVSWDCKFATVGDARANALKVASRAAMDIAREIASGVVPIVDVPALPPVRVSARGEVCKFAPTPGAHDWLDDEPLSV